MARSYKTWTKEKQNASSRKSYAKHNEKQKMRSLERSKKPEVKRMTRNAKIKRLYGITIEIEEECVARQNGVCAICKCENIKLKGNEEQSPLVIDHDHETGQIRGWLCFMCNLAIGNLKDSIENAEALVTYLKKYNKKNDEQLEFSFVSKL